MEMWKDILGYEGLYQVSTLGRIKNIERKVNCRAGSTRTIAEKIRKPQMTRRGYAIATLCDGHGNTKTYSVHQLVAVAFIPNFERGTEINHIDGNPSNNSVNNLEISNHSHNQLHAVRTGLKPKQGKTSKYRNVHYISHPRAKRKWSASIRHNGKSTYGRKVFMTEEAAAKHVDFLLDSIGDTQRLRNFP